MLPTTASKRFAWNGVLDNDECTLPTPEAGQLIGLDGAHGRFHGAKLDADVGGRRGRLDGLEAVADGNSPCESFLPGIASITTRCRLPNLN